MRPHSLPRARPPPPFGRGCGHTASPALGLLPPLSEGAATQPPPRSASSPLWARVRPHSFPSARPPPPFERGCGHTASPALGLLPPLGEGAATQPPQRSASSPL